MDSSVTPAKDVFTPASPFTFFAVTEPLLFSTVRLPLIRSVETLPKLVLAKVSPPMSVSVMPPFPVMARIPFGTFDASMAPKEDFSVTLPRASRTADGVQLNVAEGIANGHGAAHHRASLDPAIVGGAIHAAMYIAKGDVAEAVGNVGSAADARNFDVPVVVADREITTDIPCVDTSKRSCDVCGSSLRQSNRAIAASDGHRALNTSCSDAAKTIAYFESALYVRHLHGAVVVAHGDISSGPSKLNAAKGIVPPAGAGVTGSERPVAVLNICGPVNSCQINTPETVSHGNRGVGGHPNVITDGP